jgi:hypothetical protein
VPAVQIAQLKLLVRMLDPVVHASHAVGGCRGMFSGGRRSTCSSTAGVRLKLNGRGRSVIASACGTKRPTFARISTQQTTDWNGSAAGLPTC